MGALKSYSKFYYGFVVTEELTKIDFIEGTTPRTGKIDEGSYTMAEFVQAIIKAMNSVGTQIYQGSVHRATRKITIFADNPFGFLTASGEYSHQSIAVLAGMDPTLDLSGSNSYTFPNGCGFEYVTQFPLQSYLPTSNNLKAVDPTRKSTVTGVTEIIRFGTEKRMECEMMFITDIPQRSNFIIRSNTDGVKAAVHFLSVAMDANPVEFMEDETDPDAFEVLTLSSTEEDSNGLGFKLIEEYDQGFPNYFRTGQLTWKLKDTTT